MKHSKKLLAMLLALALCVGMLPTAALAVDADAVPAAEYADEAADGAADEAADEAADGAADEAAHEAADKAANEAADKAANEAADKAADEPAEEANAAGEAEAEESGQPAALTAVPVLTALSVDTTWYNDTDTSFTLYDAADLAGLASLVNAGNDFSGKTIVLGNSIDLNNEAWTPIGTSESYPFKGTFDGNDYTVSGLYINDTSSSAIRQALFGYNGGTVKNVTVSGNVTGYYNVGGVVGTNAGTVTNCTNCATVSATNNVGGVVGFNSNSGAVENCYNSGSISSTGYLGGVVGYNSGSVANCINSGTVTGASSGYDYVGGVVGYSGAGTVKNCYNSGTVSGYYRVGGVVGNDTSTVSNCYYLTGTATAGIGSDSGSTSVAAKTTTEFASGEVTWLLTGGVTDGTQAWYQTLGTDSYPVLDSTHGTVYYATACDGSYADYYYSNRSALHAADTYDSDGFCINCGAYEPVKQNSEGIYQIMTAGQLFWFAALVNGDTTQKDITAADTGANAVLLRDITIPSGYEWTPIGTKSAPYTGTFDGGGYSVSGMSIKTASTYMGLFGYVSAGTIKDLTVSGAINVSGSSLYAGGIVGTVSSKGTLSNLTSNVSVTAYDGKKGTFGGVAATVEGGSTMELCTYTGTVKASGVLDCVGGLVGYMNSATITNCANYGTVDTSGGTAASSDGIYTGGIVGYINHNSANVTNCVNVGTITGVNSSSIVSYTGAIVGRINEHVGAVTNCYYLSSEGSTLAGVGGNGSGVTTYTTAKTAAEFASGEVAYLLNGSVSAGTTWYQNIDSGTADSYPVLDSSHGAVYYGTNCAGTAIYSNSTVPAATHSLTFVEPHEATCTETGNREYWYCSACGGYFSNASGGATLNDVTIPAIGHSWGIETVTIAATCTEDGEKTYTCTVCGVTKAEAIDATGHSLTYTASENAITESCANGCGHSATATLAEPSSLAYDGSSKAASVSYDAEWMGDTPTVNYLDSSGAAVDADSVVNAGTYTAQITVGGATASVSFTITGSAYTLRAGVTDSGPYNPGDTVTANIYASAGTAANVGSFQFTLDYDANALTLGSLAVTENLVSGATPNVEKNGAALSCTIGGSYTLTVSDTPVLLATATFTVNTGVSTDDTATISLKDVELNESGTSSSGTVTVESAAVTFANITVSFAAGTGTSMTQQTAYAKYNQAGLYSDEARTTALTADTISGWVSAETSYRLATEALWSDGTNAYTSASVLQQSFTQDVTLTARAVQQFTVTFAAGANGSLTGTTTLTVDTGTTLTEVVVPTPTPNAGYIFGGWDNDPVSATITGNTTFTASFVDGTYTLTFPSVTGVTFAVGGTTTTQTTVKHGTDVTFTITASGVDVDAVNYSVTGSGSDPVPITADANGYTIPGSAITGDVSITITAANLYTVTFVAGSNGSVGGTTSFNVRSGATLTAADLAAVTITPEAGYVFYEWQDSSGAAVTPTEVEITGDTTFNAVFVDGTYAVTIPEAIAVISGVDGDIATHNTDIVFTWDADTTSGKIVTGASYLIDGVDKGTLWADANGCYTIPGSAITGDVEISVTTVDGTLSFITKDSYMALADNTQILLIKTGKLDNGTYDRRDDGSVLYYSSAYGGYVYIVPDTETAEMAAANLALLSGETGIAIGYSGDLNGDGAATTVDAMIVNDILHDLRESTSMLQYLEADVTGNGTVDTTDILWIQQKAVGLTPSATDAEATGNEGENV